MVEAQSPARSALSKVNYFAVEVMFSPPKTNTGMLNTRKQATASKPQDIFFKENVFFISGDIPLFLRLFLAIANIL
jgi:hypothetical protein